MALIEVKNAGFRYADQDIFNNVSLEINKGEIFSIIGPNGCGKTTFLDCLLGIRRLDTGSILLNGKRINLIKVSDIARKVAYVPQTHEKTFPYTVGEIVLMGRASHTGIFSSPSKGDMHIVDECLELVGIGRFKNRPYTQLSGGEGQLVMLARALAQKAPVIVMDEPTAHLDFKHELIVLETIVQMVRDTGISVVMATHFPNQAFYFENNNVLTRVALMGNKQFREIGIPSETLTEESLKSLYSIDAKVISCNLDNGSKLMQIIPLSTKGTGFYDIGVENGVAEKK